MGVPHGYFDVPHVGTNAVHASRINMNVFCSINTKLADRELFFPMANRLKHRAKCKGKIRE